ncbi:hypothetical protein ASPZODRAFT_20364 [Penicilliopsis zonata CBS 506.65]|uniref:Uncharacterized protein n=1 Tax=Penicilliopsis zonata CBS 506.65 TaxID=1073090 RepID=A0A1L9S622_9EURO|nr:hypothetical protein ASPZODRAFT_20364 [Penicilliopsis zonata CBS 506.65]OJJ42595.1 hypothetical protein ASPZODRAFT_20364 [Penicilliopsis zonata CBS 506.65]
MHLMKPGTVVTAGATLDIHLEAIELLFGLGTPHAQQWPGIHNVCRHMERNFEILLQDRFGIVWKILKRERPTNALEGWHWCLAVLRGFQGLQGDEQVSMETVYHHLVQGGNPAEFSVFEKDCALVAIFAVLCWTSMTIHPGLNAGDDRHPLLLASGESPPVTLRQSARRPIKKVFRALRGALGGDVGADWATEMDILYESSVNIYSLYTIGRVRVEWVDDLASHLAFDRQSRTLSVFCLPTFCASNILQTRPLQVLSQAFSEILPSRYYTDSPSNEAASLHREVLLSYRLLFGQSSRSRKLAFKLLEQLEKSSGEIDPFLHTICSASGTQSRFLRRCAKSSFPVELLPMSNIDLHTSPVEPDTYSARNDFPHFGHRLLVVQQYNLKQQPSRVRDLWRDRRNPLQWYTFWAVLWLGGISTLLSVVQIAIGIVQTYYSAM